MSSFAYAGKSGHYTARKEAKQRGDRYWSAYLTTGGQLTKKYLGKTADLTLARLEYIAGMLRAQREDQLPPPETRANGSPAFGLYQQESEAGVYQLFGLVVLGVVGEQIASLVVFLELSNLSSFALPHALASSSRSTT